MIVFGECNCIPSIDGMLVYNLSSFKEGMVRLNLLPNLNEVEMLEQREFDIIYANTVISNDALFYEFFSKLIYPLYSGKDVFIVVDRAPVFDSITESLIKLIQQRYGYTAYLINEPEDIEYVSDSCILNIQGVYTLDMDKERYSIMFAKLNSGIIDMNTGRVTDPNVLI